MSLYPINKNYALVVLAVLLFWAIFYSLAHYSQSKTSRLKVQGSVDSLIIKDGKFQVEGWAGSVISGSKIETISIWLADSLIYEGDFEKIERLDVAQAMNRDDWISSGWRVTANVPAKPKSGRYEVSVEIKLDDRTSNKLNLSSSVPKIEIDKNGRLSYEREFILGDLLKKLGLNKIVKIRVLIAILILFIFTIFFQADFLSSWIKSKSGCLIPSYIIFALSLLVAFLTIVSVGLTGSSLRLGLDSTSFVQSDGKNIWGQVRSIRSDEWLVSTPLAIAQYNHEPQFPIINTNIGENGQNMLIASGAPVAHFSSIAKPISWGFFFFDLRRALSWYWYFPIFSCLFALWGVIALLLPDDWKSSFLIALWFCISPYSAAWSNCPAGIVFFPSLALLSAVAILKSKNRYYKLLLGCILGIVLAGYVLFLYPPWQISLGYMYLSLAIGLVIRDKLFNCFDAFKLISFVLAIAVTSLILFQWWGDARPAIEALSSTVYPGQRLTDVGGDILPKNLLRGFTNLITLYNINSPYSNASEIASFCYFMLPLAFLFFIKLFKKEIGAVEIALGTFIVFTLVFMLFGIPIIFSEYTLWGRVSAKRADIALGLSHIIMCALLLSKRPLPVLNGKIKILAAVVSLIWSIIVIVSLSQSDPGILAGFTSGIYGALFFSILIISYWLIIGKFKHFLIFNLIISTATIWAFNPLEIAPLNISPSRYISQLLDETGESSNRRILVLESQIPAMYLLASGKSVVNGIFYYPQPAMWDRLDEERAETAKYNRYHHLIFLGGKVENDKFFQIESPSKDVVHVIIDLENFDFNTIGANFIVAPRKDEPGLRKNTKLSYFRTENGWSWFQVSGT